MFYLFRAATWAPGDLALKYAVQNACDPEAAPDEAVKVEFAESLENYQAAGSPATALE